MYNHQIVDLFCPRTPTTFGSAKWASVTDLRQAKMLEESKGKKHSPIIGCITPAEIGGRETKHVFAPPGEGHLITAGPTRSGKGLGQIITNLLWWMGSALVIDIKGENWQHTAGWRQSQGHRVIKFAPFENGSATFNPINEINKGCGSQPNDPRRQENARYLANLMIVPNPHSKEPYWDNAAKTLLQGIMLYVATADLSDAGSPIYSVRERTMAEVRRLITLGATEFKKLLEAMSRSPENWVRETAGTMNQMRDAREQTASVKSILLEHTTIWSYARVQAVTASSSFSFSDLRGSTPTTIYLIIPPEALAEYRVLLRVMVGCCMREMRESWNPSDHEQHPVLFLLDEFPQMEYMQPIEEALLYIGSYGVKFWFFIQDLSQLQKHYEKTWKQFMANCYVKSFFGVSDLDTAKLVSEMSGQSTVTNRSFAANVNESDTAGESTTSGSSSSTSSGPGGTTYSSGSSFSRTFSTSHTRGSGFTSNLAYVGRPLVTPDEVMCMPFGSMIAIIKGMPAFKGQLRFYNEWKPREAAMLPPS